MRPSSTSTSPGTSVPSTSAAATPSFIAGSLRWPPVMVNTTFRRNALYPPELVYTIGSAMAEIRIEGVTKRFGDVKAVDDVSLEIADGEFLVLVGPSGCGKSTLLRLIAGLEEVTSGSISIGGRDVTDLAPRNRDIAMVF